jgi:UPF0176 protein
MSSVSSASAAIDGSAKEEEPIMMAALYKFTPVADPVHFKSLLEPQFLEHKILGMILIGQEGINGTISGHKSNLDIILSYLKSHEYVNLSDLEIKFSVFTKTVEKPYPFARMKIRIKKEIVTIGDASVDPNQTVGTYVEPQAWNELINREDVLLIDCRNDYETRIGTFDKAVDPNTKTFREFPKWVTEEMEQSDRFKQDGKGEGEGEGEGEVEKNKGNHNDNNDSSNDISKKRGKQKVAMFCTGGIRCEKASSYMKGLGYEDVYHLKGGILKYLEQVPPEESMWKGECFVFDERVAVKHDLSIGSYEMCRGCRMPINEQDKSSPHYVPGVSCHYCVNSRTQEQRDKAARRMDQIKVAEQKGIKHIGFSLDELKEKKKKEKAERRKKAREGQGKGEKKNEGEGEGEEGGDRSLND